MLSSRYEHKYLIRPALVPLLREFMRPHMLLDPHAARAPMHRYTINSLYLDTPDLKLLRMTVDGQKNRFKLRIRSYSDAPDAPLFFEIKRRVDKIILKNRAKVPRSQARQVLGSFEDGFDLPEDANAFDCSEFVSQMHALGAGPVARVRYEREAYQSLMGDPVRVTFDHELSYALTDGWDFRIGGAQWHAVPMDHVIFEIKYTDFFPAWAHEMVETYALHSCSVPKYVLSINSDRSGRLAAAVPVWEL